MPRKRVKKKDAEGGNFFTIWADLNSFLMILFLLLYTFVMDKVSEIEQQKIYESIRLSLKGTEFQPKIAKEVPDKERQNIVDKVVRYIEDQKLSDFLNVMVEENKVRIVLAQPVLFDTGKAELKESAMELLGDIGKMLAEAKNPIIVEGHTDNMPIHTDKYDSNWDLSFDRAYSVIKYLVKTVGISPVRMNAIGYGEYRPMAPNDTPENMAKNRRIEINILLKEVFVSSKKEE
ncbi:MAG: hypothetical protein A2Y40_10510 [Candidatus Margulisbacteria bacterium GWF2_35_9]|nr:MAG: hypothetical protein A2Y40_10510 [Candidatus Margulisbacteria bacterium GWF2_35_9]